MRFPRLIMLTLLLVVVVVAGCSPAAPAVVDATDVPALISPQQTQSLLDSGDNVVLLDVRTPGEWATDGRSSDAVLIPLDELPARYAELDKDDTIVVVCRSGNRSQTASQFLRQQGFSQVTEVEGGMRNWVAQGLPIECDAATCGLQ